MVRYDITTGDGNQPTFAIFVVYFASASLVFVLEVR